MKKRVLVFAAHPDDEVLGCGGALAKLIDQGYLARSVFFTNGVSSRKKNTFKKNILERRNNAIKVAKKLKCEAPTFYNFPDNALDSIPILNVIKKIEKEILDYKPNIIFTHYDKDLNVDHQIISKAVTTATRPVSKNYLETLLFFETLSSTEWTNSSIESAFVPNFFIDIENYILTKKNLMKEYKAELRNWPHPRSIKGIEILANYRGLMCGKKNAEAFVLSKNFK
jgi:LmbE family N-acetylglucosaminyl deacetylase